MRSLWQIQQGKRCSCEGSDEYCPCQNVQFMDKDIEEGPTEFTKEPQPGQLLEMHRDTLEGMAKVLLNADPYELIEAGVLVADSNGEPRVGGSDWKRFNDDFLTFVVKLPDDQLSALADFIRRNLNQRNHGCVQNT